MAGIAYDPSSNNGSLEPITDTYKYKHRYLWHCVV